MASITLKDLPPNLHRELKARAQANGRSLNREVIAMLEHAVGTAPTDVEGILARARSVRESLSVYLTQNNLAAFKTQGRR